MSKQGKSWQVAHELFLIYLEKVETCDDGSFTLFTVFNAGAQDTLLARAEDNARKNFGEEIFRREGGVTIIPQQRQAPDGEVKFSGAFNQDASARPCITWNLGRKVHPRSSLNDKGGCLYRHVCDHWLDAKGEKICGSTKHCRINCDNPERYIRK